VQPDELDIALEELETRLERLRSLYQQYFQGIEKLEPTIPRKDVDRRIWTLRKQQIRNTGKRFRLNVLVQRYNTYQQYWQRICREIENGTYRQHVLRAERTLGRLDAVPPGARKRRTRQEEEAEAEAAEKAREATRQAEEQLQAALGEGLDPIDDIRRAMDDALGESLASPRGGGAGAEKRIPRAPRVPRAPDPGISPLDLELDGDELKTPMRPPPRPARRKAPAAPATIPETGEAPQPSQAAVRPATPGPVQPVPAKRGVPPPRSRLSKGTPTGGEAPAGAQAKAPRPGPSAAKPAERNPFAAPERPNPFAGATARAGVSDERVKQLHSKLVDAKRRTRDASRVTEEGLARSLRAAEAKLREQHGTARHIDFDVVVKNGKAVVKPIVKK